MEKELTGNEILLTIKGDNKLVFENNIILYEELDQIIHSSNKRYLVDIDKNAKISTFNNLIKKFKEKKIKKIFLKVVDLKEVDGWFKNLIFFNSYFFAGSHISNIPLQSNKKR